MGANTNGQCIYMGIMLLLLVDQNIKMLTLGCMQWSAEITADESFTHHDMADVHCVYIYFLLSTIHCSLHYERNRCLLVTVLGAGDVPIYVGTSPAPASIQSKNSLFRSSSGIGFASIWQSFRPIAPWTADVNARAGVAAGY
jgi:hypothetical protein